MYKVFLFYFFNKCYIEEEEEDYSDKVLITACFTYFGPYI